MRIFDDLFVVSRAEFPVICALPLKWRYYKEMTYFKAGFADFGLIVLKGLANTIVFRAWVRYSINACSSKLSFTKAIELTIANNECMDEVHTVATIAKYWYFQCKDLLVVVTRKLWGSSSWQSYVSKNEWMWLFIHAPTLMAIFINFPHFIFILIKSR